MAEGPDILILARKPSNARVMSEALAREGYETAAVTSPDAITAIVSGETAPGMALIDASGFGRQVWASCQVLSDRGVPFIVLSGPGMDGDVSRWVAAGACLVVGKPVAKPALLTMVRKIMTRSRDGL